MAAVIKFSSILTIVLLIAFGCCVNPSPAQPPRTPVAILERIDELIGGEIKDWCEAENVLYPPDAVLLRVFKKERELELWAKNADMAAMKMIRTIPICAMDFQPGPKLAQGDGKTPEGFYHPQFLYGSSYSWMWIRLDEGELDRYGVVGEGSSFKMCIEYPNTLDRDRSKAACFRDPGGEICLHGNCVTAGCISFTNRNFLPVFAFSRHHDTERFGRLQLHIFPFRFDAVQNMEDEIDSYPHVDLLGRDDLLTFWRNLEKGYHRFNEVKNPLTIRESPIVLREGDRSPDVSRLKAILRGKGLYTGAVDSCFCRQLEGAVRQYQMRKNLRVDGIAGPRTMKELGFSCGQYVFP